MHVFIFHIWLPELSCRRDWPTSIIVLQRAHNPSGTWRGTGAGRPRPCAAASSARAQLCLLSSMGAVNVLRLRGPLSASWSAQFSSLYFSELHQTWSRRHTMYTCVANLTMYFIYLMYLPDLITKLCKNRYNIIIHIPYIFKWT